MKALAGIAGALLAVAGGGCVLHAHPEPVGYAEVTSAPADIEAYPSVVYDGRPTYLYQNRWYYRNGDRWGYYREEPPVLREHRVRIYGQPAYGAPYGTPYAPSYSSPSYSPAYPRGGGWQGRPPPRPHEEHEEREHREWR